MKPSFIVGNRYRLWLRAVFVVPFLFTSVFLIYWFFLRPIPTTQFYVTAIPAEFMYPVTALFLVGFTILLLRSEDWASALLVFLVPLSGAVSRVFDPDLAPFSVFLTSTFVLSSLSVELYRARKASDQEFAGTGSSSQSLRRTIEVLAWTAAGVITLSYLFLVIRYSNLYPFSGEPYFDYLITKTGERASRAFSTCLFVAGNLTNGLYILCYFARRQWNRPRVERLFTLLFASYIVCALIGALQVNGRLYVLRAEGIWLEMNRYNATFTDPNALATSLILVFPLTLAGLFHKKQRLLSLAAAVSSIFLLYITASKTGFWGVAMGVLLFGALLALRAVVMRKYTHLAGIGVLFVVLGVAGYAGFNALRETELVKRVSPTFTYLSKNLAEGTLVENLSQLGYYRARWWPAAIRMLNDNVLTGIGVGAFPYEAMNEDVGKFDHAGNFYLQNAAEFGIFGILFPALLIAVLIFLTANSLIRFRVLIQRNENLYLYAIYGAMWVFVLLLVVGSHQSFHEVNFLFMLWGGLLVSHFLMLDSSFKTPASDVQAQRRPRKTLLRGIRIGLVGLIPVFVASHLLTLEHVDPLRFRSEQIGRGQDIFGWGFEGEDETEFEWLRPVSSIQIHPIEESIALEARTLHPNLANIPVKATFFLDSDQIGSVELRNTEWHSLRLEIPASLRGRDVNFRIVTDPVWKPSDYGQKRDDRQLGIAVRSLHLPRRGL